MRRRMGAMLRPPPQLTISEWAERHRILGSRAASEPGPWRTGRTPYLRAIMDALSAVHPARRVVFMKGAQVGAPLAIDTPIPTAEGWATMGALIVGDTPHDVACARAHGMRCLAVATGSAPAAVLAAAGADWVVDDLGSGLGALLLRAGWTHARSPG